MDIEKTPWKTVSQVDAEGHLKFGYEAEDSQTLLDQLQANGVYIQVVSAKGPQWIMPDNKDPQVLRGKKFRIFSENKTFEAFEKMLAKDHGKELPENRFDEFVNYTDSNVWKMDGQGGYFLDLDAWPLSEKKKQDLKDFFDPPRTSGYLGEHYGKCVGNKIFVTGKNVDILKNDWGCGALQKRLRETGTRPVVRVGPSQKKSLKEICAKSQMVDKTDKKTLSSVAFGYFKNTQESDK